MKKFLLATVGLLALGIAVPASAADIAPYTKAPPPPPPVPIYDWTGFYIGGNGGGGFSHNCWDVTDFRGTVAPFSEGCPEADRRVDDGQIAYRGETAGRVWGLEAQGDWADWRGSNVSFFIPAWTTNSKIDAFGL